MSGAEQPTAARHQSELGPVERLAGRAAPPNTIQAWRSLHDGVSSHSPAFDHYMHRAADARREYYLDIAKGARGRAVSAGRAVLEFVAGSSMPPKADELKRQATLDGAENMNDVDAYVAANKRPWRRNLWRAKGVQQFFKDFVEAVQEEVDDEAEYLVSHEAGLRVRPTDTKGGDSSGGEAIA